MRKTPRFSCTQRRSGARTRGHASHTLPRSKRPETSSDSPHASWLKEIALCRAFVGARRSESSEHSKSERAPVVQKNFFFLRVWRSSLQQKYFLSCISSLITRKTPKRCFCGFYNYMFFMCLDFYSVVYFIIHVHAGGDPPRKRSLGQSRLRSSGAKSSTRKVAGKWRR